MFGEVICSFGGDEIGLRKECFLVVLFLVGKIIEEVGFIVFFVKLFRFILFGVF